MQHIKPHCLYLSFVDADNERKCFNFFISLDPDKILNEIYNVVDTMNFPNKSEYELTTQIFAHIGTQLLLENGEDTEVFFCSGEAGHYFLTIKMLYCNADNR